MRPVVLDTSVALPAVLSPRGYRRRFLVVLALGALAAHRDLLRQEEHALRAQSASASVQVGGAALPHSVAGGARCACSVAWRASPLSSSLASG